MNHPTTEQLWAAHRMLDHAQGALIDSCNREEAAWTQADQDACVVLANCMRKVRLQIARNGK